jgi:hypothetical protein
MEFAPEFASDLCENLPKSSRPIWNFPDLDRELFPVIRNRESPSLPMRKPGMRERCRWGNMSERHILLLGPMCLRRCPGDRRWAVECTVHCISPDRATRYQRDRADTAVRHGRILGALSHGHRPVLVGNKRTKNLIIIAPETNAVVRARKVSHRPRDMHFNADHTRLYVACRRRWT